MLALDDIIRYLHYYAMRFEDNQFERWELINEAWIAVHKLKHIQFASQGIRWAMLGYKRVERQLRRKGSSTATILPLETDAGINKLVVDMMAKQDVSMNRMDTIDTISWLANSARLSLDERILIDQRFGKGMMLREIATTRNCTRQNVKMLLNRIISKLCRAARRLERQ